MARIAHLSDVHFGAHDPAVVAGAEAWLADARPDLVVISGDFTQRARVEEYRAAAAFLDRIESLGLPTLGVPGNHDVPLYDVVRRFTRPLHRYRRYIDDDLLPMVRKCASRRARHQHGALADLQGRTDQPRADGDHPRAIPRRAGGADPDPRDAPPLVRDADRRGRRAEEAVGRHGEALQAIADAGVHVLLAGHFHRSFTESARRMVKNAGPALVIQAGTATSTRLRDGEMQSFNLIHADRNDRIDVQVIAWDGAAFEGGSRAAYAFDGENWEAAAAEPVV